MFDKNNSMTQGEEIDNIVYDGIGFNGIRYIQQSGEKVQGKIYLDKTQPGLWYCLKTNTSINNTSDFTRADSVALLDKLQNLGRKQTLIKQGNLGNFGSIDISKFKFIRVMHNFANGASNNFVYLHTFDFLVTGSDANLFLSSLWSLAYMQVDSGQNKFYVYLEIRNGILTPRFYNEIPGQNDDLLAIYGIE